VYDLKENRFSELSPAHTPPPSGVQVVEYVESQKCSLAVIGSRQWVYSLEKNDWAELPLAAHGGKMGFQGPYGQMVWVARYGVFVNLSSSTWIMSPDFAGIFGDATPPSAPAGGK